VTVKVWPAIVAVPVRGCADVLAATERLTVPFPLPLVPLVIVNQLVLLLNAVQAHPVITDTFVDVEPPAATMLAAVDESAKTQGAADWLRVKVWPPIVRVPLRGCGLGFAAATKMIVASPLPLVGPVMVSQFAALLTAVHEQPAGVITAVELLPPPGIID